MAERGVSITGVGLVKRHHGGTRPFYDSAHEAARLALADAGIAAGDLDSVVMAGLDLECGRTISNMYAAPAAGGYLKDEIRVADDGLFAAALAWMRVRSGLFDTTMVLAYGQSSETHPETLANLAFDPVYQRPLGLGRLAPLAMQAQAYRHAAKGADDAADRLASLHRAAAAKNPDALPIPPLDAAAVRASPVAAAPLRQGHVAPTCDGVAALVMQARPARARDARVLGFGWAAESGDLGQRDLARSDAGTRAARDAFRHAGRAPGDVALLECHDPTPYHALLALEALGFAPPGQAPTEVLHGGPKAPRVNPSGGSFGGEPSVASGLYRLAWCVRALREPSWPARSVAMAHSWSGPAAQGACLGLVGRA